MYSMGSCFSSMYWSCWSFQDQRQSFTRAERGLDPGDIVLLAGQGAAKYLVKLDKWTDFVICGFIVRDVPGPDGLSLYQTDLDFSQQVSISKQNSKGRQKQPKVQELQQVNEEQFSQLQQQEDEEDEEATIKVQKLRVALGSDKFNLCLIRKLCQPLTAQEKHAIQQFIRESEGKKFLGKAKLMMGHNGNGEAGCNPFRCCCGSRYERFQCSSLVAQMLEAVGRVQQQEEGLYFPTKGTDMELLQSPLNIALIPKVHHVQSSSSISISHQSKKT
eukprot:TRINITY_DN7282_c0_g1_i7.p3 TRINITY_DN7282_c0_g1~~TRINITY_DN7282_c0_g1_i7.p3  ORF type:complete len:274 (+),score=31.13 TRINITY_DN7282_c0_g1_i7:360-1181(+)